MIRRLLLLVVAAVTIIALVVPGCTPSTLYNLTMAVDPAGAGTTTPTGTTAYASGTHVNIQAAAAAGYQFLNWTAPAGTFADANAATTIFTMPAEDVTVTANFVPVYDLTMTVAPAGGGTTIPTGTTPQGAGTGVNIQAAAAVGYQFVNWTAPTGTFADANAATTIFTMPAEDVTVTAHFVGPLDHFKCYFAADTVGEPLGADVSLQDQFVDIDAKVEWAWGFGNPATKWHNDVLTPISNPDHHFTVYDLNYEGEPQIQSVEVKNQFGTQQLTVSGPVALAVPTQKGDHEPPLALDHFLLYEVIAGTPVEVLVVLNDQFEDEPDAWVGEPIFFANPVKKTHAGTVTEIVNPEEHLVFYDIYIEGESPDRQVQVVNQFGEQTLDVYDPTLLAVPSTKTELEPPLLDHFKCYFTDDAPSVNEPVYVKDQFGDVEAFVGSAQWFCNPVAKEHAAVPTPILNPDNHLTIYIIDAPMSSWEVVVENQFGSQQLTVFGPVALAVPTQKLVPGEHGPPMYLDHFLLYEVIEGTPMDVVVDLVDQFGPEPGVLVYEPVFFANPVLYKWHGEDVTGVWNPDEHLVFYATSGANFLPEVVVNNQFQMGVPLFLTPLNQLLAVPSVKLDYWPIIL